MNSESSALQIRIQALESKLRAVKMEAREVEVEIRRRIEELGGTWGEEMMPWYEYYHWLYTKAG